MQSQEELWVQVHVGKWFKWTSFKRKTIYHTCSMIISLLSEAADCAHTLHKLAIPSNSFIYKTCCQISLKINKCIWNVAAYFFWLNFCSWGQWTSQMFDEHLNVYTHTHIYWFLLSDYFTYAVWNSYLNCSYFI